MASRPSENTPWPIQTPAVASSSDSSSLSGIHRRRSPKRRRVVYVDNDGAVVGARTSKSARQVVADQSEIDDALRTCQLLSGNDVISCFPTSDVTVAQHQWTSFVWNSRRPQITQANLVDIYLFHGDSQQQILHWPKQINPSDQAGRINVQVNDSWWGSRATNWKGKNISYPFYWVIISSDKTLDGNQIPQATFTAVQTTFADFVVASMSSASVASASSSRLAALTSTRSTFSSSSAETSSPSSSPGSVQQDASSHDFPHWAIAVIVVLGFLAIAATCLLAFMIIRRVRNGSRRYGRDSDRASNRNSMGSASPMMANAGGPSSPLLAGGALMAAAAGAGATGALAGPGSGVAGSGIVDRGGAGSGMGAAAPGGSVVMHDGASTISRAGSAGNEGPFSGADAAIMADAFRKKLRKPEFPHDAEYEDDGHLSHRRHGSGEEEDEIINRELAEEGRDIRSVRSERGVRVETLSDKDTIQDRHGRSG